MSVKSFTERTAETGILIAAISQKQKPCVVTDEEIKQLTGWEELNYGIMGTVKNRLMRDYKIVLSRLTKIGYQLLSDSELVAGEYQRDRDHRRRHAQRTKLKGQTVDISNLGPVELGRHICELTAAHIAIESSKDKSVERIASKANGATQPLALNHALDALKKNV